MRGFFRKYLPPAVGSKVCGPIDVYYRRRKVREGIGLFSSLSPCAAAVGKGGGLEGMLTAAAARRGAAAAWAAPAFHSSAPALSKSTVSPYLVTSSPPCMHIYLLDLAPYSSRCKGDLSLGSCDAKTFSVSTPSLECQVSVSVDNGNNLTCISS